MFISSIDWGFLWQGHHEIVSRLAKAGNRVVFIENTGIRSIGLRDARRIMGRIRRWLSLKGGRAFSPLPGLQVITPMLVPFPRSRVARWINASVMLPRLARQISAILTEDPIVFVCLPSRNAVALVDRLARAGSRVVYYCVADFRALTDASIEIQELEQRLVRNADAVFVQGEKLQRRFGAIGGSLHSFHVGVNLEVFDRANIGSCPTELADLPRPLIGYSGGLHRHVDVELVVTVAQAFPHGSVVLVGPVQMDIQLLQSERNIHLLGPRRFVE
ncbi:MAG: hypothetical protein ACREJ5_29335, partial [Geminicoccaceae bacterium]